MEKLVIPMGEVKVDAYPKKIPIKDIYFDDKNPRISLAIDSEIANGSTEINQTFLHLMLKTNPSYGSLKKAIYDSHGAMVPIWVIKDIKCNKYLVVEGNTRLAIYKELLEEYDDENFRNINCMVLDIDIDVIDDEIKDFIRLTCHLKGTTEWDKYEQAKYLYILHDAKKYPIKVLSTRTKLSTTEICQDIKAYKIMTDQFFPNFPDPSNVHKYSYFKEYVKDKKLLSLMEQNNFTDFDFCCWVGDGKFDKAVEIRQLKDILSNQTAREKFIEKDFDRALELLKDVIPEKSDKLYKLISEITDRLAKVAFCELEEIRDRQSKKRKILLDLHDKVSKILGID